MVDLQQSISKNPFLLRALAKTWQVSGTCKNGFLREAKNYPQLLMPLIDFFFLGEGEEILIELSSKVLPVFTVLYYLTILKYFCFYILKVVSVTSSKKFFSMFNNKVQEPVQ